MKPYRLVLPFVSLLGALCLTGCPKPAPPQALRPPVTDSRPANSQPGGFLKDGTTSPRTNTSAESDARGSSNDDPLAVLGNPDDATESPRNQDHFLMARPQMTLSYNNSLRFPNWVAWHLEASDIGDVERSNFIPDPDLPQGFEAITTRDYSGSGYDRGHNCPSKDRTASTEDNQVVFYMSNITPQQHGMNAGPWEGLETYCRKLAQEGNELYILCGHGFRDKNYKTIGRDQIAVPDFGWKIVIVLPQKSGNDLKRITAETRIIAVEMPNISTISRQPWDKYVTTVAELEQSTGLTFLENLPSDVAQVLKQKRDEGASSFAGGESGFKKSNRRSNGGSFGSGNSFGGGRR